MVAAVETPQRDAAASPGDSWSEVTPEAGAAAAAAAQYAGWVPRKLKHNTRDGMPRSLMHEHPGDGIPPETGRRGDGMATIRMSRALARTHYMPCTDSCSWSRSGGRVLSAGLGADSGRGSGACLVMGMEPV